MFAAVRNRRNAAATKEQQQQQQRQQQQQQSCYAAYYGKAQQQTRQSTAAAEAPKLNVLSFKARCYQQQSTRSVWHQCCSLTLTITVLQANNFIYYIMGHCGEPVCCATCTGEHMLWSTTTMRVTAGHNIRCMTSVLAAKHAQVTRQQTHSVSQVVSTINI